MKQYKSLSRVKWFSSITQVCLFLWTKASQVCSSYHSGTRLGNVDWCNIIKITKNNHLTHLKETFVWNVTPQSLHQHDNNSSTFSLWVVPCPLTLCLHVKALSLPHKTQNSYSFNIFFFFLHIWLGLTKIPLGFPV